MDETEIPVASARLRLSLGRMNQRAEPEVGAVLEPSHERAMDRSHGNKATKPNQQTVSLLDFLFSLAQFLFASFQLQERQTLLHAINGKCASGN